MYDMFVVVSVCARMCVCVCIHKKVVIEPPPHNYKHIKYQRRVKQTKVNILQERGTKTLIKTNLTRQDSFILETGVSSSLIGYPI